MKNEFVDARAPMGTADRHTKRSHRSVWGVAVTVAAAGILVSQTAIAQPQISASSPNFHAHVSGVTPMSGQRPFHTPDFSTYLAGYQITEPGISRASVSFVVPTMTCGSDTQGTAEGIGNEQTEGSPTLLGIVFTACIGGSGTFTIDALAGGHSSFGTANAGDRINIIVIQSRTNVTVTVNDVTTAIKTIASGTPTPDNTLTFGSFPLFSGGKLPVANFGNMRMQSPTLENASLQDWTPIQLTRKNGTVVQVRPTAFGAQNGGFGLQFVNN
jgi:hypothetical protein